MINAKKEILEHIGNKKVEFVSIAIRKQYGSAPTEIKGTLNEILPLLDFSYDDGYGSQKLFGYIWYEDGSWSDRYEYDGAEGWQHLVRPEHDVEVERH